MPEIDIDIYLVTDMKKAKESTKDMQPTVKEYKPRESEEKENVLFRS